MIEISTDLEKQKEGPFHDDSYGPDSLAALYFLTFFVFSEQPGGRAYFDPILLEKLESCSGCGAHSQNTGEKEAVQA